MRSGISFGTRQFLCDDMKSEGLAGIEVLYVGACSTDERRQICFVGRHLILFVSFLVVLQLCFEIGVTSL